MTHHHMRIEGRVQEVFAHRFTLVTEDGVILADLTPDGLGKIALMQGDAVVIEGERKPSEIRVSHLTRGDLMIEIEPKGKAGKHGDDKHRRHEGREADLSAALAAVRHAGFRILGEPRRKPKHLEVLGLKAGEASEIHVGFDGRIRHARPVDRTDPKWANALEHGAD